MEVMATKVILVTVLVDTTNVIMLAHVFYMLMSACDWFPVEGLREAGPRVRQPGSPVQPRRYRARYV